MGSISEDGPGQHNPDRSEDPWGTAVSAALTVVHQRTASLDSDRGYDVTGSEVHEGRMQTARREISRRRREGTV